MNRRIKELTGSKKPSLGTINKKRLLKLIIKAGLTVLAVYVVVNKIDVQQTGSILMKAKVFWFIPAFLFFNFSKWISAIRLNTFFKSIGLYLDQFYNLKLYYVGMFYNLFLPGGIGGDGYKVYLLNKYHKKPVKILIGATLLDRISGLVALLFLALLFCFFVDLTFLGQYINMAILGLTLIIYPVYYLFYRIIFKKFLQSFHRSNLQSLGVQAGQVISAFFLLWALDINVLYLEYLVLFLLSSVVAVLPFTIGGVGARELVFVFGANYLMIDKNTAVAFSILFFLVIVFSSLGGIFFETGLKTQKP